MILKFNQRMLPDTYLFNPTCEPAIANGSPYYTPSASLRKFEADLGYLPGWLGVEKDEVLVQAKDLNFEAQMRDLGFRLPSFLQQECALADSDWMSQPKGRLLPWGWSPAVYQLFKKILPSYHDDFHHSPVANWCTEHKKMFSRLSGMELLCEIKQVARGSWLPDDLKIPVVCNTVEQIWKEVSCYDKAVVKMPWSSSGRGLLIFPNQDLKKKNDEILSGMLNQQEFVTVEPWYDKVMDLSYQFSVNSGKIEYHGSTIFETDPKGRYIRNYLGEVPHLVSEAGEFVGEHSKDVARVLLEALSHSDYSKYYEGWIGVDSIVCRTIAGGLKIQPVIEINGRFTMGAIALNFKKNVAEGSTGFLQIFYSKSSSFQDYCARQEKVKPLKMSEGQIVQGILPLTPPLQQHNFGAFVEVFGCS